MPRIPQRPRAVDLDGDGTLEIAAWTRDANTTWIQVHSSPDMAIEFEQGITGTPGVDAALFDVDDDGRWEITFCTLRSVNSWRHADEPVAASAMRTVSTQ